MIELSEGGIKALFHNDCPELAPGSRIDSVVLHVNDVRIGGTLRIIYTLSDVPGSTTCGAKFVPTSVVGSRALAALLDTLERKSRGRTP